MLLLALQACPHIRGHGVLMVMFLVLMFFAEKTLIGLNL